MNKIKILSPELANQIAAGEVIERPSSVVKELVENAIDAAATSIAVHIFAAGREKIIVEDDGTGMSEEDAILAFQRHATSKLLSEFDLFRIKTLGFRGEALPSIASISKVCLTTSNGIEAGTQITISAGESHITVAPARKGTTVEVEELFYNTPARLKYLKTDTTENANSIEILQRLALAHPEIAFTLTIDGREVFHTTGRGDLLEVIMLLYGTYVAKRMQSFSLTHPDFSVQGYLGKAELFKSNRFSIITLLNGRNVYLPRIQKAIIDGYQGYIPPSRFPFVVLHFKIEPSLVDVNVHPSKREVRFSKESELEALLIAQIPLALTGGKQTVELTRPVVATDEFIPINDEQLQLAFSYPAPATNQINSFIPPVQVSQTQITAEQSQPINASTRLEASPVPTFTPLGQIGATYILALDDAGGFYLFDQHAAAERINYEKFQLFLNRDLVTREPLIPLIIDLPASTALQLDQANRDLLRQVGIELVDFGPHAFKVVSLPLWAEEYDERIYVNDLLEQVLTHGAIDVTKIRTAAIATMACKASIKANHRLSNQEMQSLIEQLFACQNPYACPHGRPTIVHISAYELAKWFKRTGV